MRHVWQVTVTKKDLVSAIAHARTRATLRRKGAGFEHGLTFVACPDELSIRSSAAAMDVAAEGEGCSPVMANGAAIRRLAPKLAGPAITLCYEEGRPKLNGTSVPAREVWSPGSGSFITSPKNRSID
jgi:hypothetical protein